MNAKIKITVDRGKTDFIKPPAEGFIYVAQGNFQSLDLKGNNFVVYSDSATSCIICIVVSRIGANYSVTLAHLDSPSCICAFFNVIKAQNADEYQFFAQGANPAQNISSQENAAQLKKSVKSLGKQVTESQLYLQEGNPRDKNRGHFGMAFDGNGTAVVSNQPYTLQLYERDPSFGGQTVYCIMRRHAKQEIPIRDAGQPFTHTELVELSSIALVFRKKKEKSYMAFTNIVNLQQKEILENWSSTPDDEPPWFCDQLKMGAVFAIAMSPVVNLSAATLSSTTPLSFAYLRNDLLGE